MPLGLTNDRSPKGIVDMLKQTNGTTITTAQINPVSLAICRRSFPTGNI